MCFIPKDVMNLGVSTKCRETTHSIRIFSLTSLSPIQFDLKTSLTSKIITRSSSSSQMYLNTLGHQPRNMTNFCRKSLHLILRFLFLLQPPTWTETYPSPPSPTLPKLKFINCILYMLY